MKKEILILCFLALATLISSQKSCTPSYVKVVREQLKNINQLKADLQKKRSVIPHILILFVEEDLKSSVKT